MAKERKKAPDDENGAPSKRDVAVSASDSGSESENDSRRSEGSRDSRRIRSKRKRSRSSSRKSREDDEDSYTSLSESESESYSDSYSDSESRSSEEYSGSELEERRRRRRKERRKREEKEKEKEKEKKRRRRKEKEKKRRRKEREEKEEKRRRKNHKDRKKKKKKRDEEKGKKGAVTDSWGKYGIIRETDLWNKRPEFTAWLAEVKQVNLESLPNWEEKQMFKDFMEDHNTATFPSRKYYNLDAYHRRKMEKEMMRGPRKVLEPERIIFNDEEQRRLELLQERERQKELEVEALKRSMQGGLAQAMKEQAQLKEEMAYQYKIGNFEAAAAIQRRLDPDIPM